jgi:hypothetical protein
MKTSGKWRYTSTIFGLGINESQSLVSRCGSFTTKQTTCVVHWIDAWLGSVASLDTLDNRGTCNLILILTY